MKINKLLFASMLMVLPVFAAEGVPGATINSDGARPPHGRHGAMGETCKAGPEQCRRERMAMREKMCAQNPEKCKEMKAKMEQRREACKADPEKCRQQHQARAAEHFKKSDADGNGSLSRAEAEKGMPRLARRFDMIDANKDGQLSREEMSAARKAHHGAKGPGKS
ncbi:MAG: hypothetical protein K2X06_10520 [Burkholderiales bacterium]|nr:hypothetical protein [Burkholderiales bacterium]